MSSQHCYSCDVLSSSGITRLHRYYDAIRLPLPRLPFSLYYRLSGILASQQESSGSPGLPHIRNIRHAMVSDPGETPLTCHSPADMLTSVIITTSSLSTITFRGSIPSTLRLTAYRLAVLRLISGIAPVDPRTRYPVAGQPSGAGFTPAKICDLARPHDYFFFFGTDFTDYTDFCCTQWKVWVQLRPLGYIGV